MKLRAGWYPDQTDKTQERFWNETVWTSQTRPVDAARLITDPSLFALREGWYPAQSNKATERYWNGASWTTQIRQKRTGAASPPTTTPDQTVGTEEHESRGIFYRERLSCGTFAGAGCLTLVMFAGAIFLLSEAGINPHGTLWSIAGWTFGILAFVLIVIAQLTVAPEETNCPECGKRFRDGYDTCRQCGYTKAHKA